MLTGNVNDLKYKNYKYKLFVKVWCCLGGGKLARSTFFCSSVSSWHSYGIFILAVFKVFSVLVLVQLGDKGSKCTDAEMIRCTFHSIPNVWILNICRNEPSQAVKQFVQLLTHLLCDCCDLLDSFLKDSPIMFQIFMDVYYVCFVKMRLKLVLTLSLIPPANFHLTEPMSML